MLSCTSSLLCCSARTGFVVTSGLASLGHIPPFPYCIALHGGPMIPQGNITRHMIFQRCSCYGFNDFHAPITFFFLNGTCERAIYSCKDDTSLCSISSAEVPPSLYNLAFHPSYKFELRSCTLAVFCYPALAPVIVPDVLREMVPTLLASHMGPVHCLSVRRWIFPWNVSGLCSGWVV